MDVYGMVFESQMKYVECWLFISGEIQNTYVLD